MLSVAAIAVAITLAASSPGRAVTPVNRGDAGGTATTVNNGAGDQSEPRVSGNLGVYTNRVGSPSVSTIHYFDFAAGADHVVPNSSVNPDQLPDVSNGRIVFSRTLVTENGRSAVMLFDTATGSLSELDPQLGSVRFGAAINGPTVAFGDFSTGNGDVYAYDLTTATASNLTHSAADDSAPAVNPAGDQVVWQSCAAPLSNCDVLQSVKVGGAWGSPTVVAATPSNEQNPDTDGATIVYDSDRPSATGADIYFQTRPGPETALQLPGTQSSPRIAGGVIAFESADTPLATTDIYAYVIATNTLYRVTNTPTVNEILSDVTMTPSGAVRVVWAADDDIAPDHNVYARTFTVPLSADAVPPVLALPPDRTVDATSPAGAVVTYTVTATDAVDPAPTVSCSPASGSTFPIGTTTVSCTASDASGNTSSGSFRVTVLGAKEQLNRLAAQVLAASTLPPTVRAQLLAALAGFDPADPAQRLVACVALRAFIAAVQTQAAAGRITAAQAALWTTEATQIRAVLGC
jgi:hypothetical protein